MISNIHKAVATESMMKKIIIWNKLRLFHEQVPYGMFQDAYLYKLSPDPVPVTRILYLL